MSDRHQILNDQEFWTRLEFSASRCLESSDDKALRRFWIDGFLPQSITDTGGGADIVGTTWVGVGGREQWPYRFVVSVPQKMLDRGGQSFSIELLSLDEAQRSLRIEIVYEKQIA